MPISCFNKGSWWSFKTRIIKMGYKAERGLFPYIIYFYINLLMVKAGSVVLFLRIILLFKWECFYFIASAHPKISISNESVSDFKALKWVYVSQGLDIKLFIVALPISSESVLGSHLVLNLTLHLSSLKMYHSVTYFFIIDLLASMPVPSMFRRSIN